MWISNQKKELLELFIIDIEIPVLVSGPTGSVLWANPAFEEFIGYTLWELTTGSNGRGINWETLTVAGESLEADKEMARQCINGERDRYSVKKQYIPKNDRPVWVDINVVRYPQSGPVECFIIVVVPMKNGTQAAFAMSMDRIKELSDEIRKLQKGYPEMENNIVNGVKDAIEVKTETEQIFVSTARLINRNPKVSAAICLIILIMILGTQLVQAIETTKKLMGW